MDQYVAIPNDDSINTGGPFPERTVELIFNADTVSGRQVLWEEGGRTNSLSIYIDDGSLRVNGRTTSGGGYGPLDISIPIEAGKSYHVAFTQEGGNNTNPGRFIGYLNGQEFGSEEITGTISNHPNLNAIGAVQQNIYFHDDGPVGNSPSRANGSFAFDGQISDVAIYNRIIDQPGMQARYEATSLPLSEAFRQDTQIFIEQIQGIIEDTSFRGINLLNNEDAVVDFNFERTSQLKIDGQKFSVEDLNLDDIDYQKPSQVRDAIINIRKAIDQARDFGAKLASDLSIIQTRQEFTRGTINTFKSGAEDLIVADQNKEGANLLAAQTRLDLSTTALSLAAESRRSILEIFSGQ